MGMMCSESQPVDDGPVLTHGEGEKALKPGGRDRPPSAVPLVQM